MKFVPNPPNLDEWRTRLFNVDDIITLTEEECVNISLSLVLADLVEIDQVSNLLPTRR